MSMVRNAFFASTTVVMMTFLQTHALAYPPPPLVQDEKKADADKQTSQEAIKDTPFTFPDSVFKVPVFVYEAVGSGTKPEDKKLYLGPLCQLVPWDAKGKERYKYIESTNGLAIISFRMVNYHNEMFIYAADRVLELHKVKFSPKQFSMMQFSLATFKFNVGGVEYKSKIGDMDQSLTLPDMITIQFEVPVASAETIKKIADSDGGLNIETTLVYNALGLKRRIEQITFESIQATELGRTINSGGASFYTLDQVENMLTQGAIKQGIYNFEDPGMPIELETKARAVFNKAMKDTADVVVLKNLEDFRAADEAIRRASGITAKDFMPMELHYKYQSDVLSETDYKKAISKVESNFFREKTSLSASAKGSYGPVSGRISYNRETDKVTFDKFESQEKYDEHKKDWLKKQGDGADFKPRGLNLVEKGSLKKVLNTSMTSLTIRPVAELGKSAKITNSATNTGDFAKQLDIKLRAANTIQTERMYTDYEVVQDVGGSYHRVFFQTWFSLEGLPKKGTYHIDVYEADDKGNPTGTNSAFTYGNYNASTDPTTFDRTIFQPITGSGGGFGHTRNGGIKYLTDKGICFHMYAVVFDKDPRNLKRYYAKLKITAGE